MVNSYSSFVFLVIYFIVQVIWGGVLDKALVDVMTQLLRVFLLKHAESVYDCRNKKKSLFI